MSSTRIVAVWAEGHQYRGNSSLDAGPQQRIIGDSVTNTMPWPHSHEDLQQFTRDTKRHVMVMGRKTFESLPKSMTAGMPGRVVTQHRPMIVLTRDPAWAFANQVSANEQGLDITFGLPGSPERVLAWSRAIHPTKSIAVIGGPSVIELFRNHYDALLITWHHSLHGWHGDVRAPFTMGELTHDWWHADAKRITPTIFQHTYTREQVA